MASYLFDSHDRWIRLRFTDGVVQDVDLGPVFVRGGVFEAIRDDDDVFAQVRVSETTGTVEWPGDVDLDPDVLYGTHEPAVNGPLERRTVEPAR